MTPPNQSVATTPNRVTLYQIQDSRSKQDNSSTTQNDIDDDDDNFSKSSSYKF